VLHEHFFHFVVLLVYIFCHFVHEYLSLEGEHLNNSLLVECFYGIMKFLTELSKEVILFTIFTIFYAHSSIENAMNGTFMVVINFLVFPIVVVSFIFAHFPILRAL
jgi:hypothetical protein